MRQLVWASVAFCVAISGCQDSKQDTAAALNSETGQARAGATQGQGSEDGAEHKIELDFGSMRAGEWKGKRFSEIVPPNAIKRIVRTRESGFAFGHGSGFPFGRSKAGQQEAYEAFFAHLMSSAETAEDWGLSAQERTLAELVILTDEDQLLRLEIVADLSAVSPSAILLYGEGKGARIDVEAFKISDLSK